MEAEIFFRLGVSILATDVTPVLTVTIMTTREPLETIVETAVTTLLRRRAPAAREDLVQEGMVVALETERRYPKQAANGAYVYRAVIRRLGNFVSHELAAVSMAGRWELARDHQARVPLDAVPTHVLGVQARTPEHDLLDQEEEQALHRWRVNLQEYLNDKVLPELEEEQRQIVLMFYGLDGLPARTPRDIASTLKCSALDVYRAREKMERVLRDSIDFYSLRQQLQEVQSSHE